MGQGDRNQKYHGAMPQGGFEDRRGVSGGYEERRGGGDRHNNSRGKNAECYFITIILIRLKIFGRL